MTRVHRVLSSRTFWLLEKKPQLHDHACVHKYPSHTAVFTKMLEAWRRRRRFICQM